jgi:hypothetical protein
MTYRTLRRLALALVAVSAVSICFVAAAMADSRQISASGTASPLAAPTGVDGAVTTEFAGGQEEDGIPDPFNGIIDRSLSNGVGNGVAGQIGRKAKSNAELGTNFEGLNHYQQRYANSGNQFSVEPPDQGLCVGNGYIVEAVNDVVNVFNTSGDSVLPDNTGTNVVSGHPRNVNHAIDLNHWYGYPAAINRSTGAYGPELTDPTCLYDAQTQRFYMVVLTLNRVGTTSSLSHVNHLDIAVSDTSDPTGTWTIYKVDVTYDGSNPDSSNACPCLGDYPHIGADATGFYVTTNSYPWAGNGFDGAQIYAMSKTALASGGPVTVTHLDTFGTVNASSDAGSTQPGFTVWPAQSPGTTSFNLNNGGTEYFLSSNAADEATHPVAGTGGNYTSSQVVVWTLTNTSSLNTVPALSLSTKLVTVDQYALPPKQVQPGSGTAADENTTPDVAFGDCINDTTTLLFNGQTGCWRLVAGAPGSEVISRPDANDTRMQQVDYANGKLWGALDTAVSFDNNSANNRAGIAWYILNPDSGSVVKQGTYGVAGASLTYPAIGVTAAGRGVMGFSYTDATTDPSAAYASIDASAGLGDYHIIATGAARADGFTSYKSQVGNPPRTRWGDYGAAAVDGNTVWLASEMTQRLACNYTAWGGPFFAGGTGDNLLGTCGGASWGPGTRSALANWSTHISELKP